MPYWYIACAVIIVLMTLSLYNNSAVESYIFTEYNEDGTIKQEREINRGEIGLSISIDEPKSFKPIKPLY